MDEVTRLQRLQNHGSVDDMASRTTKKKPAVKKRARPKVKAKKGAVRPRETPREITVFDPEEVTHVLDILPDDDVLQEAADRLSGLGHPSRLKAVIALSVSELCVGDIAAIVGLSLSATSTLLKQLRSLGFLTTRSAGKQTYYRMASPLPQQLLETLFAHSTPVE